MSSGPRRGARASAWLALAMCLFGGVAWADPPLSYAQHARAAALAERGEVARAEAIYRAAPPDDVDALAALGELLLDVGRDQEAVAVFERLRIYDTTSAEPIRRLARATLSRDPVAAADLFEDYLRAHDAGRDPRAGRATALAVAAALIELDAVDRALGLLDAASEVLDARGDAAWEAERERLSVVVEARRLARSAARPLPERQRAELAEARVRARRGDVDAARAVVDTLVAAHPLAAEAWAALAEIAEREGDIAAADHALQRAEALEPFAPRHPAELGRLLATWYGGEHDAAAAEAYARALRLDPTWADGWWERAALARRAGELPEARRALARFSVLAPHDPRAEIATRLVDGADRRRPEPPVIPDSSGCPDDVSVAACDALWRAVAWQRRGRIDLALDEVEALRAHAAPFPRALNLEASLRLQSGDTDAAIALYRASLAASPSQELPRVVLWELLRAQGADDEASALLHAPDAAAIPVLHCLRAREAWEAWRVFAARTALDACFGGGDLGRYEPSAIALRDEVHGGWRRVMAGGGLLAVFLALGVPGWLVWRRSGVGVEALLAAAPQAYPEVARHVAAIRHEVLKHYTSVLPAVADALDRGDPAPAWWVAEGLYGEGGAISRFHETLEALRALGRRHGVRLNLRRRDPVFAVLIGAMEQLARLEPELQRGAAFGLPDRLRAISSALNHDGYRGLGQLLSRVCVLTLDARVVDAAWRRAGVERGGRAPVVDVALPDQPVRLRLYRRDLEDVLVNLLRNAIEAGAGRLALRVVIEQDEITGLERAALRVCDDAAARLTTAMIRGRYIERGLGLTVDAISRAGGSIHVEPEPGWSKAVVVRLPIAEEVEEA